MSIDTFRKMSEKGCGTVLFVGCAVVLGLGIFAGPCSRGAVQDPGNQQNFDSRPAFRIGDYTVTTKAIMDGFQKRLAPSGPDQAPPNAQMQAQYLAQTVKQYVDDGLLISAAKKKGISVSQDQLKSTFLQLLSDSIAEAKKELVTQGKAKQGATEAEMDAAFKSVYNQTPKELIAGRSEQLDQALADPATVPQLLAQAVRDKFNKSLSAGVQITDLDLAKQTSEYVLKGITVTDPKNPNADTSAKVKEIKAALAGGMSYEAAMEKYSTTPAPPDGKRKKSDVSFPVRVSTLEQNDQYAPLLKLKVGDVSDPIKLGSTEQMFKLVRIDKMKADVFAKQKEDLRKQMINEKVGKLVQEAQIEERKAGTLKWSGIGLEQMHTFARLAMEPEFINDRPKYKAELKKLIDSPMADGKDPDQYRASILAHYGAMESLNNSSTDEEKKKLASQRLEMITQVLNIADGPDLHLTIAEIQAAAKNKAAGQALFEAAKRLRDPGFAGQSIFGDLSTRLVKYKAQGLVSAEDEKNIQTELDRWTTEKRDYDKMVEMQKKRDEEERKKFEEEQKKAEREKLKPKPREDGTGAKPEAPKKGG